MSGKLLIEYNRKGCIGADICTLFAPDHFKMSDERKVDLLDSKENNLFGKKVDQKETIFTKEADEADLGKLKQAADGCPAKVIVIKNKDGQKLAPLD